MFKRIFRSFGIPFILSAWLLRQTKFVLLVTGLCTCIVVTLACTVPLYSRIATTAGLRNTLQSNNSATNLQVHLMMNQVSSSIARQEDERINVLTKASLANYLDKGSTFSVRSQDLTIVSPKLSGEINLDVSGYAMTQVAPYISLIAGRLPQEQSRDIEICLTPATAGVVHAHVGSIIRVQFHYTTFLYQNASDGTAYPIPQRHVKVVPLHVIGLYKRKHDTDALWLGYSADPISSAGIAPVTTLSGLASRTTLFNYLDTIARGNNDTVVYGSDFNDFTWQYRFDNAHIAIDQLDSLIHDLQSWQNVIGESYGELSGSIDPSATIESYIALLSPVLHQGDAPSTLEQYRLRLAIARNPITVVSGEVLALALLFLGIVVSVLIEWQEEGIVILVSRGASRWQVMMAFVVQGGVISLIALCLGPLLALLIVWCAGHWMLAPAQQGSLNLIQSGPGDNLRWLAPYDIVTSLMAFLVIVYATARTLRKNILVFRRESARIIVRPWWQRYYLDFLAIVLALVGYAVASYADTTGQSVQSQIFLTVPLKLITPTFLLVAALLISFRLIPWLMNLGLRWAVRRIGAPAMLAFSYLSRSYTQALRLVLLLTITCSFTIFSIVFLSSQQQHTIDLLNYQIGADFSASLNTDSITSTPQKAQFQSIPGITSVTLGYVTSGTFEGAIANSVQIAAVDASTFAQTIIWTNEDSTQSLTSLMALLSKQRIRVNTEHEVPVIIDDATMEQFHLSIGSTIALHMSDLLSTDSAVTYVVVASVHHIPTSINTGDAIFFPGMLVDYQSYVQFCQSHSYDIPQPSYVWLRTADSDSAVAHVRAALSNWQYHIASLSDRRAAITNQQFDPLYVNLSAELIFGMLGAPLLAFIGNLVLSRYYTRRRLMSFAILHALGSSNKQMTSLFAWENGTIYALALVLGIGIGSLLSVLTVPLMIFSSDTQSVPGDILLNLQQILPVHIIFPVSLIGVLLVFITVCGLLPGLIASNTLRLSLDRVLRLNED